MQLRADEISRVIKERIASYSNRIEEKETGYVMTVGDGIAKVHGLENCMSNELLEFDSGVYGMALNLEENYVYCVMLGSDSEVSEGDIVKRTGRVVSVPVGDALIGRVVDALGQPIDGRGPVVSDKYMPIERKASA